MQELAKEILDNIGLVEVNDIHITKKVDMFDPFRSERTIVTVKYTKNGKTYTYNPSKFKNLYELDGIQAKELNEEIMNEFDCNLIRIVNVQTNSFKAKRQKRWR